MVLYTEEFHKVTKIVMARFSSQQLTL